MSDSAALNSLVIKRRIVRALKVNSARRIFINISIKPLGKLSITKTPESSYLLVAGLLKYSHRN